MFTTITSHTATLAAALVVLSGGAILGDGAAAADPNQDEQFGALLDLEEIPSMGGMPSLIATAHKVCSKLDGGMPVNNLVDAMRNNAYDLNPILRLTPSERLTSTMTRFITAAVRAYCPYDQGKVASLMANPAPASHAAANGVAPYQHTVVNAGRVLTSAIGAVPLGELNPPNPPQIPPPMAQIETPPRSIAAPRSPKQAPPAPRQLPPPPQQPVPPAAAPGGVGGSGGGSGGNGGGGSVGGGGTGGSGGSGGAGSARPAQPAPLPPMAPGWVRLAP